MQYKKYKEYKDSGVEWLGNTPEHWAVSKLKYIGEAIIGLTYTPDDIVDKDQGTLVLRSSNLQGGLLTYNDNVYVDMRIPQKLKTKEGDIVICSRNGSRELIGKNALIDCQATGISFGAFTTVFRSNYSRFIHYILNSSLFKFQSGRFLTTTINQLTTGTLNNFEIPFPSTQEQKEIAEYLDEKTAQIDSLIEKQTQLIELLKEKRQATISHAVTKGLNPNAPMKDSGVEWLGDIPEHWIITKFRYVFSLSKGLTITKADLQDDGIPCVSYGEVHSKYGFEVSAEKQELKCVDRSYLEISRNALLSRGDFIFADTSEDLEGAGNFTHLSGDIPVFAGYHSIIARQLCDNSTLFLAFLIDSLSYRTQIRLAVKGVKVFSVTQEILRASIIWLPPVEEQKEIAKYLDEKTTQIDTLIKKANQSIELLKEKRTALISAAVTGKIDVRGLA